MRELPDLTAALDAVELMVNQYLQGNPAEGYDHDFMSAGEAACDVLTRLRPQDWRATPVGMEPTTSREVNPGLARRLGVTKALEAWTIEELYEFYGRPENQEPDGLPRRRRKVLRPEPWQCDLLTNLLHAEIRHLVASGAPEGRVVEVQVLADEVKALGEATSPRKDEEGAPPRLPPRSSPEGGVGEVPDSDAPPTLVRFDPDWVVHPGEVLAEWATNMGLADVPAAERCGLDLNLYRGLITGDTELTSPIAGMLETGTQIGARFWLNMERIFRTGLAAGKTWMKPGVVVPDE